MSKSGHNRHPDDWYVEPAWCVDALLQKERPFLGKVLDPCCGGGNIVDRLMAHEVIAFGSDMRDRKDGSFPVMDYTKSVSSFCPDSVISNPPFKVAQDFIDCALASTHDRVAVLLRLAFLEGRKRREWFQSVPLARVWVSSNRISMPPGGTDIAADGGKTAHAWFVFEHGYSGSPSIGWIEKGDSS